jgi:GTPase SAR1 family protein
MINHYYRNVHAIVYVYDVTNLASFENLPGWINECDKHVLDQDLPRVLVGNKCDVSSEHVVVPNAVAQRFAVRLQLTPLSIVEESRKSCSLLGCSQYSLV